MAQRHRTIEFHVDRDDCDGGGDDKKKERPSEFIVHQDQIREKNEIKQRELYTTSATRHQTEPNQNKAN